MTANVYIVAAKCTGDIVSCASNRGNVWFNTWVPLIIGVSLIVYILKGKSKAGKIRAFELLLAASLVWYAPFWKSAIGSVLNSIPNAAPAVVIIHQPTPPPPLLVSRVT